MIREDIIKRYLNGEATEEDLRMLQTYLDGKDFTALEKVMNRDWRSDDWPQHVPPRLSEEMWQKIGVQRQKRAGHLRLARQRTRRRWLAAAGIFLALGIMTSLWLNRSEKMITLATGFGEWKAIVLPDSSWVKLNANSAITYAPHWEAGTERKVWLKGEAFFKVVKGKSQEEKFRVVTQDLEVEVLGTSFNVNSRDIQTDVFLEEGQIRLSMGEAEEFLQPGDFVAYSAQKKAVIKREKAIAAELHTSWKDGILRLKDQRVADILARIEGIYGVRIEVLDEELLSEFKTISIPMDKLEIAIPILEGVLGAEITEQEGQLIIQ